MGFDELWARVTRILGFTAGLGIMVYETVVDSSHDRPYLYAAAVGMMGLPIARTIESIASRFGSPEHKHEREMEIVHETRYEEGYNREDHNREDHVR